MAAHVPAAAGHVRPPTVYYRDYFTDANNDVFGGDYTVQLKPYVMPIGVTPAHSPQDCRTLAFDARSQGVPTAFLLQHKDDNKLHIYIQLDRITPEWAWSLQDGKIAPSLEKENSATTNMSWSSSKTYIGILLQV